MLNYLGALPEPQQAPTMPQGMPGVGGPFDPTISSSQASMMMAPQMGPAPIGAMADPNDPAASQYSAVTQEDGSILLHLKNPDGSLGPAVKIVPPIQRKQQGRG